MSKDFEIARLHAITEARTSQHEALAYAWSRRVYPGFHTCPLVDAFEGDFAVGSEKFSTVLQLVDDDWMGAKALSFYDIEGQLGSRTNGEIDRSDLIAILRYVFLSGRFDDELWRRLTVNGSGPIESQGIADPFNPTYDASAF
jgi:hypothetical protein